jgi:hypothetical protein
MPALKARQSEDSSPNLTKDCRTAMSTDEPFRTDYEFLKGVDYIFVSLDRNLSGEECHELAEKYFETHKQMTLPGQVLLVDLRPAFRKPLADVTPHFRAVSKGHTFTPQR